MSIALNEILQGKHSVALGGHIRPDGDCVGSSMGLYLYLKEQFPELETDIYLEPVADCYKIVSDIEEIKHQVEHVKQYDLFICLDCGDAARLGFSAPLFEHAKQTM